MKIFSMRWKARRLAGLLAGLLMATLPLPTLFAQDDVPEAPQPPQANKLIELFRAILEPVAPPLAVEVQGIMAAPMLVDNAEVAGDNDQWKALEQQFTQQFRPIFDGQLHFLKATCKPTDEQFKIIKKEGEAGLKKAVKKVVDLQKKMQVGGFQVGDELSIDPAGDISAALLEIATKHLPKEAAAKYTQQMERRAEHRRHIVTANLVSRMDRDLLLSKKQREQIQDALLANWKDEWGRNLIYQIQDEYQQYPNLPDNKILPLLTDRQAAIWKNIPRQQGVIWGWGGFMGGMVGIAGGEMEGAVIVAEEGVVLPAEIDLIEKENVPVAEPEQKAKVEEKAKPQPEAKP